MSKTKKELKDFLNYIKERKRRLDAESFINKVELNLLYNLGNEEELIEEYLKSRKDD